MDQTSHIHLLYSVNVKYTCFTVRNCFFLYSSYEQVMTGLNDRAKEGEYRWVDSGRRAMYIPWVGGDPNKTPGDGDCSRLRYFAKKHNTWLMADGDCKTAYNFICKIPLDRGEEILCEGVESKIS